MADTAVTIPRADLSQLSLQEQARGFSNKFHVDYTDVALGTGSTDTVTMTLVRCRRTLCSTVRW